ncbi:diguanylate cyclase [Aeromonas allosaccharophila]|uniref:sensor domain-containing diguanylate cyclase n=1 Tax=Aeromonas allosaccharophila TaxID=656 RepID=UPI001F16CA86|nr:sensor domain-containing diguanylate cyclase [Aeromonas allosaccharophila]MCE9849591.1 diguanylate cyclase [Aeromonas allosaccharophila]
MPNVSATPFLTRLTWLLFALVILLVGLTLRQSLKQIERLYQSDTLNSAIYLRDQFKQIEVFLEAMRGQAEERLRSDPQSVLTRQLYGHIEALPDGLALDTLPANLPAGLAGNLTGTGPLPPPGSEREARMHLALSLSPLLATASEHLAKEIAWVYFIGVDNFIYLYPWQPSSRFRFYPALYQKYFWQDALTTRTPDKGTVLSRPYEDFLGLGTMITMSQPLYKDGTLVGMISMDVLLARLQQQLNQLTPALGEYLLLNQYHQVLASSARQPVIPQDPAPTGEYRWRQGRLQLTMAIPDTPLRLVHNVTLLPLAWAMLCQSAPTLLAILFMLLAALSNLRSHRLNLRLNYLSCHDALTGAFNRHYLERLEQGGELARLQAGILMFDADHFKRVNDTFGHAVGDMVLIRLVQLCQQQLGPSDKLIRWGGEEFLLLISHSDASRLGELAEQIRLAVADHHWAAIEPALVVTISLGYHPHEAGIPLHEAVRRADVALYQAKANGRNRSERWQGDASGLAE